MVDSALYNEIYFSVELFNKVIKTYSFLNDNCCNAAMETVTRKLNLEMCNYSNY